MRKTLTMGQSGHGQGANLGEAGSPSCPLQGGELPYLGGQVSEEPCLPRWLSSWP